MTNFINYVYCHICQITFFVQNVKLFVEFFFMNHMKMMKNTKEEANFLDFFCHVGFY